MPSGYAPGGTARGAQEATAGISASSAVAAATTAARSGKWQLQRLGLTTALQRWASFTVETRQMVIAAQRVVARVQYASVAQAYGRWVEYSDQLRRLSHIGSRLLSLQLSRALEAWTAYTSRSQQCSLQGSWSTGSPQSPAYTHQRRNRSPG